MKQEKPYVINKYIDNYARKNWYSKYWIPAATIKTTVNVKELSAILKTKGLSINSALIKALAKALSEFPKLNYYTFWGKLIWAGEKTRISIIIEERKFEECGWDTAVDAENKSLEDIQSSLTASIDKVKNSSNKQTLSMKLMNLFPRISYYLLKITGQLAKEFIRDGGPIILTNLNVDGIDETLACGVYFAMIVCPGKIKDGKMSLSLSFNHELANARPIAAFLARVKEILEKPEQLAQCHSGMA